MCNCARRRVIVADDQPAMLARIVAVLGEHHDVAAAVLTGSAAVESSRDLEPDAIVLDVAMPGMTGIEAAAAIRRLGVRAPITFISSHADDAIAIAAMAQGASGFVAKPRMHVDLLPAIEQALAGGAFLPSPGVFRAWARPAGRRHDLQLYTSDTSVAAVVAEHFERAIDAGDALLAFSAGQTLEALHALLASHGIDVAALRASGRYVTIDPREALEASLRNGMPDAACFAAAVDPAVDAAIQSGVATSGHVTAFGAIAPLLWKQGAFDAMHQLEQIAHDYVAARPISILCLYPRQLFLGGDAHRLAALCAGHSATIATDRPS